MRVRSLSVAAEAPRTRKTIEKMVANFMVIGVGWLEVEV